MEWICVCLRSCTTFSMAFNSNFFLNWLIYALVSRSNSNLACDSLSCLNFFSCTVASVRKHVADAISATTPTAAKMNDQPGMWDKRISFVPISCGLWRLYRRNCWHAPASIYLYFPKSQTQWPQSRHWFRRREWDSRCSANVNFVYNFCFGKQYDFRGIVSLPEWAWRRIFDRVQRTGRTATPDRVRLAQK